MDNAPPTGYSYSHEDSNRRADKWEEIVAYVMEGYYSQLPVEYWALVRDLSRDRVLMTRPSTIGQALKRISALSRYLLWATQSTGEPVGPDLMRPRLINRYLLSGFKSNNRSERAKTRSQLLICLLDGVSEVASAREIDAIPQPDPNALSWKEVVEAFNWAQVLSGDHRPRAEAWIALAAGCGAMTSEIQKVLRGDVLVDEEGVSVRIGGTRPRIVPVLEPFAKIITRLGEGDPTLPLANWMLRSGASRADYGALKRTQTLDAPPRLRSNRLRGFWYHQQLQQLQMLSAFVTASGLRPSTLLNNWGRLAEHIPHEEEVRRLREPGPLR